MSSFASATTVACMTIFLPACTHAPQVPATPPDPILTVVVGPEGSAEEIPADAPPAPDAPPTAPAQWRFEIAPDLLPDTRVPLPDHVDLLGLPIRAWFFRPGGRLTRIRVVGHGSEEAGRETSIALRAAALDPSIDGFWSYGIAEFVPRDTPETRGTPEPGPSFDTTARSLQQELERIARQFPGLVEVHEVTVAPDGFLSSLPTIPGFTKVAYAFADSIPATEGPSFAPVRSWDGSTSSTAAPIQLEVTAKELGLDDILLGRLGEGSRLSPWIDAVTEARGLVDAADANLAWVRDGAKIDVNTDAVHTLKLTPPRPPPASAVTRSLSLARTAQQATALLAQIRAVWEAFEPADSSIVSATDLAAASARLLDVIRHDEHCLAALARGGCSSYIEVTLAENPPEPAGGLADFATRARAKGIQGASRLLAMAQSRLAHEERELRRARLAQKRHGVLERASVIDAILRGWPVSTGSAADDARIDKIIAGNVPRVWTRILSMLGATGINLSTGLPGGDLVGPSIFYRIHELGNGSFRVVPTYVVHGDYIERWSPSRRTVTIVRPNE